MISASALMRNCGYPRVLGKVEPTDAKGRAARAKRDEAAARGTLFHGAIETWVRDGVPGVAEDAEVQGWIDLLASKWAPPPGTHLESAWGISPEGDYVPVVETEPHVYVAEGRRLATAGRADAWWIGFDGLLYVVDWKTGRWPVTPPATNLQINGAGLALSDVSEARGYVPGIYYARDGVFEWGEPVLHGEPARAAILADVLAAAQLDDAPRPGPHCGDCWESRMNRCAHAQKDAA